MRWRCGGGCCWRSRKRSGPTDPAAKRRLLTFVLIGGGPTGVELAGALAEIARHTLRHEFDTIDPESARIVLDRGRADDSAVVPRVAARFSPPRAAEARRRGLGERAGDRRRGGRRHRRRRSGIGAHDHVGGGRRRLAAREVARAAARSHRPRRGRRGSLRAGPSIGLRRRRPGVVRSPDRSTAARGGASGQTGGRARRP